MFVALRPSPIDYDRSYTESRISLGVVSVALSSS